MRTVTEQYWIVTAEYGTDRAKRSVRISPPDDVDDADRIAQVFLAEGAIRVCVEPFRRVPGPRA
jgi:hypothetical protein